MALLKQLSLKIAIGHFVPIIGLSDSFAHSQPETMLEIGHRGNTSEQPVICPFTADTYKLLMLILKILNFQI